MHVVPAAMPRGGRAPGAPRRPPCPRAGREEYDGELQYDLGNLMVQDLAPLDPAPFAADADAACHSLATRIFQSLTARRFALPSDPAPVGRMARRPPPTTVLPREKPAPKPRPPTKWEQFAQVGGWVGIVACWVEHDGPLG